MTTLTTISHTDLRKNGITVETMEYFDENRVLVKKQLNFFNADKQLTLKSIEDLLSGITVELKPKPASVQPLDDSICFIKTIYKQSYMMSQGTADKDGEYHGIVSVFKPHKTRYEEYEHGQKVADHTHPIRDRLVKLGIVSAIASSCALLLQKCELTQNIYNEQSYIRVHE